MFKFDPSNFNYEKAVQNSESSLEKEYYNFPVKMQTLCHVVPLSSTKIGIDLFQFKARPLNNKLFGRSVLSLKINSLSNPFLATKMEELGYTHGVRNSNGVLEYRQCPIQELSDKMGLEAEMPEKDGKKGKIIPKEVTYYVIVPYATRAIPSEKQKNPPWTPVNLVQPYWVIGSDGKANSPHLRPVIEQLFVKSKGQVANLNGTTYMAINRLGDSDDTVYSGEVITDPKDLERPSANQVINLIEEKFESLQPVTSLSFMIPARSELETLARKAGIVLESLSSKESSTVEQRSVANVEHQTVTNSTGEDLLDL